MYDFQNGYLNFNLNKLKANDSWPEKLESLMEYFENDSQIRDILITGGDALMSSDKALEQILDAIYAMASRKKEKNVFRPANKKFAEIQRVRLGTRLPAYLPQRITSNLVELLKSFKQKASEIGIKQFVIQTHFESPMEVTPEAANSIDKLIKAGWIITNQHVFTTAASRRGHNIKLREVLNDIGVLPYYTFSVKGYMENYYNFAPNARAVQESIEEKTLGNLSESSTELIKKFSEESENIIDNINSIRKAENIPFIATDRNVLNLPGVGKSLTYRVVGITRYGRRVLEFEHDGTRSHSPIIEKMKKIVIIESKSISEYLNQLEDIGENRNEYTGVYGYSIGETEPIVPIYQYPDSSFTITKEFTNLEIPETEYATVEI
jgi:lysine 2,3-aminomutase